MKGKILVVLLLFLLVIASSANSSTKPVFRKQAAGFSYKVTIQNPVNEWEIGYKDNVDKLNIQILKLIIWIVCIMLTFVTAFIIKKKIEIKTSILALLITRNVIFACINIIPAAFAINSAYKEAAKYYQILANY